MKFEQKNVFALNAILGHLTREMDVSNRCTFLSVYNFRRWWQYIRCTGHVIHWTANDAGRIRRTGWIQIQSGLKCIGKHHTRFIGIDGDQHNATANAQTGADTATTETAIAQYQTITKANQTSKTETEWCERWRQRWPQSIRQSKQQRFHWHISQ